MKKFLLFLACIFFVCGCSKEKIDINTLSDNISKNILFEEELTLYEGSSKELYNIDFAKKAIIYVGSGATAEELAIIEFDNQELANKGYTILKSYIDDRKKIFSTYNPVEVKKLDNAVLKQKENVVIMCVSNDENALKIIEKNM